MDEAIVAERGGFGSRAELMREAVENLLNELDFPDAAPEAASPRIAGSERGDVGGEQAIGEDVETGPEADAMAPLLGDLPDWERSELTLGDLAGTALRAPDQQPVLVRNGVAQRRDEPLLGLHNRDYVSIWALRRLARYTEEQPILFEEYLQRVTRAAWYYGWQLQGLEGDGSGRKLTVLFPTNLSKRPSAERGFQTFAVGSLGRRGVDGIQPSGPLFSWQAVQVDEENRIGLTEPGWRLMQELNGLSLDLPHAPDSAVNFLRFLAEFAPGDRWGFDQVLLSVTDGPDRERLVSDFAEVHSEWTRSTASSIAQGYVARAREWGLVEPRLVDGRYWLTETGRTLNRTDQSADL